MNDHQLLTTRLHPPTLGNAVVARPRLYTLLEASLNHRLLLLCAATGYGKTTLVADWLARGMAAERGAQPALAWVSLSKAENDPTCFWAYVLAALAQASPACVGLPEVTSAAPLVPLLNALSTLAHPLLLVLDDYQHVSSPEIARDVGTLIEQLPPQVHVLLLTTQVPAMPLARWRARGLMSEIRAEQLRCTANEAAAFFAASGIRDATSEQIALAVQQVEGWFAGLRLLSLAAHELQAPEAEDWLEIACGAAQRHVREYLVSEVWAQQSPELQAFLLRSAVLDELSTHCCAALLGDEAGQDALQQAQQLLEQAERLQLFVTATGEGRYRYHKLFRQSLRTQLEQHDPQQAGLLLQRLSAWQNTAHQPAAAISRAGGAPTQLPPLPQSWASAAHLPEPTRGPDEPLPEQLTPREHEVLALIAQGAPNTEIAGKLCLSVHTVKRHISNILAKLNATNRTQAVAFAQWGGLLFASQA